ncbi:MAG: hypothetical protein DWI12_08540 [Planctomycetota bacterium]|nr:MAG: hypothetical protein DWI12_08540 [Planctomycetota bacterium]
MRIGTARRFCATIAQFFAQQNARRNLLEDDRLSSWLKGLSRTHSVGGSGHTPTRTQGDGILRLRSQAGAR